MALSPRRWFAPRKALVCRVSASAIFCSPARAPSAPMNTWCTRHSRWPRPRTTRPSPSSTPTSVLGKTCSPSRPQTCPFGTSPPLPGHLPGDICCLAQPLGWRGTGGFLSPPALRRWRFCSTSSSKIAGRWRCLAHFGFALRPMWCAGHSGRPTPLFLPRSVCWRATTFSPPAKNPVCSNPFSAACSLASAWPVL